LVPRSARELEGKPEEKKSQANPEREREPPGRKADARGRRESSFCLLQGVKARVQDPTSVRRDSSGRAKGALSLEARSGMRDGVGPEKGAPLLQARALLALAEARPQQGEAREHPVREEHGEQERKAGRSA